MSYTLVKKVTTLGKRKFPYVEKDRISKRRKIDNNDDYDEDEDYIPTHTGSLLFGSDTVYDKDNHIYFRSTVNGKSVNKLINIINEYNTNFEDIRKDVTIKNVEPNPIYLHITSYGGCLFSCFRAIDCIKNSKIPIYTIIDGHAASAGTLISVVGEKRFITPHSYALIHQLSSGVIGKFWAIKDEYTSLETIMDDIYNIYIEHTDLTKEDLEKLLAHDIWWNAKECVEKTLVDEIYTKSP